MTFRIVFECNLEHDFEMTLNDLCGDPDLGWWPWLWSCLPHPIPIESPPVTLKFCRLCSIDHKILFKFHKHVVQTFFLKKCTKSLKSFHGIIFAEIAGQWRSVCRHRRLVCRQWWHIFRLQHQPVQWYKRSIFSPPHHFQVDHGTREETTCR